MLLYLLLESQKDERIDFLKKQLEPKWGNGLEDEKDLNTFIKKVSKADPSLKGVYMQWIARVIMKNPENRIEDLGRLKKDLENFEKFKSKIEKKDINQYKSFSEIFSVIEPFTKKIPKTSTEKAAARREKQIEAVREEITIVYSGSEGWIRIPKTKKAAQYLGQSTRWCTSAKGNNMFDHYNTSDSLFVIYEKSSQKRWQLHVNSGQFANEKDEMQDWKTIPTWARSHIYKWYSKNTNLTLKQMISIKDFANEDDDISAGSGHEDLFALMKQHGI